MHVRAFRVIALFAAQLLATSAVAQTSLRFFGDAVPNRDRVMIRIDPHVPADVGATDFTLEFWMKANAADNDSNGSCSGGGGENWITGNIMFDRAIWLHDRFGDYGISIFSNGSSATLAFGVFQGASFGQGLCGTRNVANGQWHHVAVTRAAASGQLRIYVDGQQDAEGTGPSGNISYENGVPSQVPPELTVLNVDNYLGIGAEKFDADGVRYPSYAGFIDEVRLSTTLRYTANFTPPAQPFVPDANTAALYHFDEGTGTVINDSAPGGASVGERRPGGANQGPQWSTDTPFAPGTGTLQLSATSYAGAEGGTPASIVVRRLGGSQGAATVNFQASPGTATAGADYSPPAGNVLNWAANDAADKSFAIAIIDDADVDPGETVTIAISNATGATLGTPANATLTITDNDAPQRGALRFTQVNFSSAESAASATISVERINGDEGAVSVSYASANGTAIAPGDYGAASGVLNWSEGNSTGAVQTFAILLTDDVVVEANETVALALTNPMGGATLGNIPTATFTIVDNDNATSPGSLQFSAPTLDVNEGAVSAQVSVTRTVGSSGAVSVVCATTNGSATAPADYASTSQVLSWAAGDVASRSISVPIVDDALVEGLETVNLVLSGATGGAVIGAPGSATLRIADNDVAQPGTLQLEQASYSVNENGTAAAVRVTRTGGTTGAIGVQIATAPGSAAAGADFSTSSTVLTWAAGDSTAKSASVAILDDTADEADETLTVTLSAVSGGAVLGTPASATITIVDNDTGGGDSSNDSGGGAAGLATLLALLGARFMRRIRVSPALR